MIPRYPYPNPLYLTPADEDGKVTGETFSVLGRNISEMGLDFYHNEPLADRFVIASLEWGDEQWVGLLMELTWSRFNRYGWYQSGGGFLRPATSPV